MLRPMALNPTPLRLVLAVIPPTTARFGATWTSNAPDGGLSSPSDGLLLPIGLGLAGVLLLVIVARWRLKTAQQSEAAESDASRADDPDSAAANERNLPRWLDPSVVAARFRTDTTTAVRAAASVARAPARAPILFSGPIDELAERMRVRYDGVPLLDRPDDVLGRTLGELDGGDEVELLERGEIWVRVQTPKGLAGWVPSMTFARAAAVAEEEAEAVRPAIQPEPPAPADEPPTLEALLQTIAAQRLAQQERAGAPDSKATVTVNDVPTVQKRPRSRPSRSDRLVAPRLVRPEPARGLDEPTRNIRPEPAAQLDLAPAAPTRPRSRKPRSDRPAAHPG